MTCPREGCTERLKETYFADEGWCLVHGPQFIGEATQMRAGTDGARFAIRREPRHDSPNKLKQGVLK